MMGIDFIDISDYDKDRGGEDILDITNIRRGSDLGKLAICEKCVVRYTQDRQPFVKYMFRDGAGRSIVGREFGIDDIGDAHQKMKRMLNTVVYVSFDVDYFNGLCLRVKKVIPAPEEVSTKVKDKFFTMKILGYDTELEYFETLLKKMQIEDGIRAVFEYMNVEFSIQNGSYPGIMEGLKGSALKMVNTLSAIAISMYDKVESKRLITAYILVQTILAVSNGDALSSIKVLNSMEDIVGANITPSLKKIYELTKSSIYMIHGFSKDMLDSGAIFIEMTHRYLMESLEMKTIIDRSIGIFEYNGAIVEKR